MLPLSLGRPLPSREYTRARALGDGSYGTVCVAYCADSGAEVAAKTFDQEEDGSLTTETIREISALRLLSRVPHIVPLLDVAWELSSVPGVSAILPLYSWSVADAIENGSSLFRGAAVLNVAVGLLKAVAYMHSCRPPLVHRDIKPENVMLDENMEPVLIDFSFCKFLEEERRSEEEPGGKKAAARKKRKRQGESTCKGANNTGNLGTPTYVAPEVLAEKEYDGRADVWSLGVLFIEAFQKKRLETDRDKAAFRIIADLRSNLGDKEVPRTLKAMLDPESATRCTSAEALISMREAVAATAGSGASVSSAPPVLEMPETTQLPRAEVRKICRNLNYRNPQTMSAASHYLNVVGALEASRPPVPLFATMVAGKVYERDCLDAWEVQEDLGIKIDLDDYCEFEENLFRLSGCCLFTPIFRGQL